LTKMASTRSPGTPLIRIKPREGCKRPWANIGLVLEGKSETLARRNDSVAVGATSTWEQPEKTAKTNKQ